MWGPAPLTCRERRKQLERVEATRDGNGNLHTLRGLRVIERQLDRRQQQRCASQRALRVGNVAHISHNWAMEDLSQVSTQLMLATGGRPEIERGKHSVSWRMASPFRAGSRARGSAREDEWDARVKVCNGAMCVPRAIVCQCGRAPQRTSSLTSARGTPFARLAHRSDYRPDRCQRAGRRVQQPRSASERCAAQTGC